MFMLKLTAGLLGVNELELNDAYDGVKLAVSKIYFSNTFA